MVSESGLKIKLKCRAIELEKKKCASALSNRLTLKVVIWKPQLTHFSMKCIRIVLKCANFWMKFCKYSHLICLSNENIYSQSVNFWRIFPATMRKISHFSIQKMAYERHHVDPPFICPQSIYHQNRVSFGIRLLRHILQTYNIQM